MRSAEHCDRAALAEEVAERVGQLRRLGKGADENHVEIGGKLLEEIFHPGVADKLNVVTFLLAPDTNHLRHDARQVGVHHPAVERWVGTFGYEIEDADAKPAHADRKSTRLNSSHANISYAVFCLKKKKNTTYCTLFCVIYTNS